MDFLYLLGVNPPADIDGYFVAGSCRTAVIYECVLSSRLFKATTGETFSKYLLTMRLKEAAELLKNSGLRISEIGEYVGFRTISGNPRQFNYRACK